MIDMGLERPGGILGYPEMGSDSPLADVKRSQLFSKDELYGTLKDRLAFEDVVCQSARSSRGSAEIDRMRPATPVPPPETEIQPPGVPGLSGLLTRCGGCRAGGTLCGTGRVPARGARDPAGLRPRAFRRCDAQMAYGPRAGRHHCGACRFGHHPVSRDVIGFQVAGLASDIPRYQTTIESKSVL